MGYAGGHRVFTYASLVLSAVSALMALIPFLYIWMILRDVLAVAPDYAQAVNIPHYGWMAVLFAVLSYLIYIAARQKHNFLHTSSAGRRDPLHSGIPDDTSFPSYRAQRQSR